MSIGPFTALPIYVRYLLTEQTPGWPKLTCIALQSRDSSLRVTIITDGMEDYRSRGLKTLAKAASYLFVESESDTSESESLD